MSALPYMPLYVADYLADTAHLSALENGAYLLLIMNYWQRGKALPSGGAHLARIARVSPKEWESISGALEPFFERDGDTWVHGRIEAELEKVRSKSKQASKAGKISSQRKANARSTPVEQTLNHTDTDTDRTATSVAVSATPKDDLQILETKLREAAGWQREPHPNLCVVGPIAELIATGASLELDILPVIRSRAPSVTSRTGWRYFIAPIQDAVKARVGVKALVPGDAIALESRRRAALEKLQAHNLQVDLERKMAANG